MIVNKYSILMLFMAGLGLAVASLMAGAALWTAWRIRSGRGERESSAAQRSVHLAALTAVICVVLLAIGWPLLYAMLNSFVPEVPGAMCIYGVTRVMPLASAVIQTAKPLLIFLLGAWLLLECVRRQSGRPPRRWGGMAALAVVAGLVAAGHVAELYYVFNMNSLNEVSCCSRCAERAASKLQSPAYYLPWAEPDPAQRAVLNGLFFVAVPLLAAWLFAQSRRRGTVHPRLAIGQNLAILAVAAVLALASLREFSEVIAPLLMRSPFHHCFYCLISSSAMPDASLIVANLAVGTFSAGWAAVLGIAMPAEPPPQSLLLRRRVCILGATTLAAAVLMVVIHLAVLYG